MSNKEIWPKGVLSVILVVGLGALGIAIYRDGKEAGVTQEREEAARAHPTRGIEKTEAGIFIVLPLHSVSESSWQMLQTVVDQLNAGDGCSCTCGGASQSPPKPLTPRTSKSELPGIMGIVVDMDTVKPIEGATVTLEKSYNRTTKTDARGRFHFFRLPTVEGVRVPLTVSKPGYVDEVSDQSASLDFGVYHTFWMQKEVELKLESDYAECNVSECWAVNPDGTRKKLGAVSDSTTAAGFNSPALRMDVESNLLIRCDPAGVPIPSEFCGTAVQVRPCPKDIPSPVPPPSSWPRDPREVFPTFSDYVLPENGTGQVFIECRYHPKDLRHVCKVWVP